MNESAPGLTEMLGHWALDLPWLAALGLAAALYGRAWVQALRPGAVHPRWKAACFFAGLALVGVATVSPLEHYGNRLLWVNFTGFLLLTMLAAPLLLLGSPLTLAFRAAGPRGRAWLRRFYQRRPMRSLTFPITSWLLFAVVTYLWQFSAFTDRAAANVFLRDLQQSTLLGASLLFWMPALCADPQRWRMAFPLRALYVFLEMTHKGLFGGMFLSMSDPIHPRFAANLPAWGPEAMTDQRMAILVLWIGGNIIFLVALVGIAAAWIRYEGRATARTDRRLALARAAAVSKRAALDAVFGKPL
ncbi:MAG: cytochrome c oxidase assembly protein [Tepidiformaceae bacterium]